ncbi:MAG: M20/M25/M40 family metallo-hydrolase [Gemmatimonadota bacterium]
MLIPLISLAAGSGNAQSVSPPPSLGPVLDSIRASNEWTLAQQQSICEIPSPPFKEHARAVEFSHRLIAAGLSHVRLDSIGNVIGERPGRGRKPVVVLAAHLDTVFPEGTDVSVHRDGTRMRGPGIGDDCRGLAVLLTVARAMTRADLKLEGTVLFVGTVGEEGLGDLRGVRYLVDQLRNDLDYFVTVDLSDMEVSNRAVGSHRYEVRYYGPGGHSFNNFGMPNPIHALGRAIAKISALVVPLDPRTTFNVGVINGGSSVNAISGQATMQVDLRSESAAELDSLDSRFHQAVEHALQEEKSRWPQSSDPLQVEIRSLGLRPAGQLPDSSRILRVVQEAARSLGDSVVLGPHSTDANVPLSRGIQAIAIGHGGHGEAAHSLNESYDDGEHGWRGPQWALLVVTRLAGLRN